MASADQPLLSITTGSPKHADHGTRSDGVRRRHMRFLDRGSRFHQSQGRYNIIRVGGDWRSLYTNDIFHTVINTRTSRIITGIFVAYSIIVFLFALCFLYISWNRTECNVGLATLTEAYIFSLETIMTIGYGAPTNDIFYGGCKSMAVLLTLESFAGIFLDSICIGMFYARFARANKRAETVMFTRSAVIRKIRGDYYFMFQVCERRKHQLVEAHVRLYAMRHITAEDGSESLYQSAQMRVQQPDDDCGAMLLIALPQTVVHRIDPWSPLFPPECLPSKGHYPKMCPAYPEPMQRLIDIENGNRDGGDGVRPYKKPTKTQIMDHLHKTDLEVVVILEGIDCSTSNTMQARHSYTDDEIAWDCTFENCVAQTENGAKIDFDRFHSLKRVPQDVETCTSASTF